MFSRNWENPRNISKSHNGINPGLLPQEVREIVESVSKTYQVPFDFSLMIMCSVLATATRGNLKVQVKENWQEPLSLFTAPLLEPSNRKSAVIETFVRPILEIQSQARLEHTEIERLNKIERDLATSQRNQLLKKSEKGLDTKMKAELSAIDQKLENYRETKAPTFLIDDTTPEALTENLCFQNSQSSIQAEGQLLDNLSRYSENGTPNLEAFNKAYSCEPISVHRKGKVAIFQDKPHLVLCIGAQPEIIKPKLRNSAFINSGFSSRFLITLGKSQLGNRTFQAPALSTQIKDKWNSRVKTIWDHYSKNSDLVISVENEALAEIENLHYWLEPQFKTMPKAVKDWAGKLIGNLIRIACLFSILENHKASIITAEQMKQSASLAPVLLDYACQVFAFETSQLPEQRVLEKLLNPEFLGFEGFEGAQGKVFTQNQLFQKVKDQKWCKSSRDLREVLYSLENLGWIITLAIKENPKGGRPQEFYELHPEAESLYQELFS